MAVKKKSVAKKAVKSKVTTPAQKKKKAIEEISSAKYMICYTRDANDMCSLRVLAEDCDGAELIAALYAKLDAQHKLVALVKMLRA